MLQSIGILTDIVGWSMLAIAAFVLLVNESECLLQARRIVPWAVVALAITGLYSVSLWVHSNPAMALKVLSFNVVQVIKDSIEATAGLVLW